MFIKRELSFIIWVYLASYFLTLSILFSNALSTNSAVTILDLAIFAHVAASPIICAKSLNLVESFLWLPASFEEYSIILAIAYLSRGGSSSCRQNPWTNLASFNAFSLVKGASSSNSTFILNNFLKSESIAKRVWYISLFPISITFKSNGIGSGFKDTITIDERWSWAFSIVTSLTLRAFFNAS